MSADQPGLACIVGKHLFVDVHDAANGECVGGWCLWCGTAAYDGDRITEEGQAVGFTPTFEVRLPAGFFRLVSDAS